VIVHALHVTVENHLRDLWCEKTSCSIVLRSTARSGRASRLTSARNLWLGIQHCWITSCESCTDRIKILFANPAQYLSCASSPFNSACLYPAMRLGFQQENLLDSLFPVPCSHYRPSELRLEQVSQSKPYNLMIHQPKKAQRNHRLTSQKPHY